MAVHRRKWQTGGPGPGGQLGTALGLTRPEVAHGRAGETSPSNGSQNVATLVCSSLGVGKGMLGGWSAMNQEMLEDTRLTDFRQVAGGCGKVGGKKRR